MRPILLLFFACLFFSCSGSFQEGEAYYNQGNYQKAISNFNRALFLNVTDVKSLHLRARAYEELGELENAREDYLKIIKLKPKYAHAHAGLGNIAFKQKKYKEAEKHLLLASYHDHEDFDIIFLLGRVMLVNENYKSAEQFLEVARELNPEEPMVYYYQGIARGKLGDPLGTAGAFNMYISLTPDNIHGLYNRGFAYMTIGAMSWALEDFDLVLKKNPMHYEAMARRGVCRSIMKDKQGCADLKLAAKNGSQYAIDNLDKYCP